MYKFGSHFQKQKRQKEGLNISINYLLIRNLKTKIQYE